MVKIATAGLYNDDIQDNDLKKLDAGFSFYNYFTKIYIPTLKQVLAFCKKNEIGLNIELKPNLGFEKKNVEAIAIRTAKLDEELLKNCRNLKIVARHGVGFDNVDLKAASDKGILVCNVPDYCTNDVADHTLGLMLDLARGIHLYSESVRDSMSWDWNSAQELHRLTGATMGIIGLGRIGTATALRAKAFGMNIVFYDPRSANVIRSPIISSSNKLNSTIFNISPKEGLLVLFPSYLHHSVNLNKSEEERMVISFNINLIY